MPQRPASAPRARLRHAHSAAAPNARFQPEYMLFDADARGARRSQLRVDRIGDARGFGSLGYIQTELAMEATAGVPSTKGPSLHPRDRMRRPQSASQLGRQRYGNEEASKAAGISTPPRADLTATTRGPAVVKMSASLATRWREHLKSSGLDLASGRKAVAAKHVQRVRRATSQRSLAGSGSANSSTTASQRPFSAGGNGRPTSAISAALSIAAVTDSLESKQKREKKTKEKLIHRHRRERPKSANPRGRRSHPFEPPSKTPFGKKGEIGETERHLSPFERFGSGGAAEQVGGGSGMPVRSLPMGVGIRDFIDNVRSLRRSNIIDHTTSQTTSNMRNVIERELREAHTQQLYDLRARLAEAERNLADMTDRYNDSNRQLTSAMDERSSLAFNVTMVSIVGHALFV